MNTFKVENFYHLLDKSFHIPSYQRGYRWEKQQVEDLLNDFAEFIDNTNSRNTEGEFYCLQPIVVKRRHDNRYEVIDGQQRLTTIYLLMKYLEETRMQNCNIESLYTIKYERTTENSIDYLSENIFIEDLQKFNAGKNSECEYPGNIDSFFIFQSYQTIDNWFKNGHKNLKTDMAKILTGELSRAKDDKKNDIRIIWYEQTDNSEINSIETFTRLNEGKIPLTETELVKALLFQCDCYSEHKTLMKERAFRRSCEWDDMEKKLQEPDFWAMLANEDYQPSSHIDLIIRFVSKQIKASSSEYNQFSEDKDFFSFLVINEFIKKKITDTDNKDKLLADAISEIWQMIQDTFIVFHNWFIDKEVYHLIGLLTLFNSKNNKNEQLNMLQNIYKDFTDKNNDKDKAKNILRKKIGDKIRINIKEHNETLDIHTINYHDRPDHLIKVLEAFNVYLHIKDKSHNNIFRFDKFKKFKVTSLEHIHPQNLNTENMSITEVEQWFNSRKDKLDSDNEELAKAKREMSEILEKINDAKDDSGKTLIFKNNIKNINVCQNIIDPAFDKLAGMEKKHMHTLHNMALVDKDTNSALSNNHMYAKRSILHKRENKGLTYVPEGTYSAFNKEFSDKITDMTFWSPTDRDSYFAKIEEAYNYFTQE